MSGEVLKDQAPQTFAGNCMANTVPSDTQRYVCPLGPNVTLQTDPALAEIIIQEETIIENFRFRTTGAQPVGDEGLWFQLIKNGVVISQTNVVGPGAAANSFNADFPNGPHIFKVDDTMCLGLLNTGNAASAKICAFGLG